MRGSAGAVAAIAVVALAGNAWAAEIDPETGLVKTGAWEEVRAHCGICHALGLVTSQQGGPAVWIETIRRMRESHNMYDLAPESEARLVAYLAEHFAADAPGTRRHRRAPLPEALMPSTCPAPVADSRHGSCVSQGEVPVPPPGRLTDPRRNQARR